MNRVTKFLGCILPTIAGIFLSSFAATGAHATLMAIDESKSSVTYTEFGFIICDFSGCTSPEPKTFVLSGSFEVQSKHESFAVSFFPEYTTKELDLLFFSKVAINSGGAAPLGFNFPDYPAVLDGSAFLGNADPCSLFFLAGSTCMSMGPWGGYSGIFDGDTISLTGSTNGFFDSFSFTIVATALPSGAVPTPSTFACIWIGLTALVVIRRSINGNGDRRSRVLGFWDKLSNRL